MTGILLALNLLGLGQGRHTTGADEPILAPPAALSADGFYSKCVYFRGLAIVASHNVNDRALRTIVVTFTKMLAKVPETTTDQLVKAGSHYCIIAAVEGQTDLPEYRELRNDKQTDWNKRARGLGGLITSGGEENILEYPSDRYKGECIYIHEFAHTLANYAFSAVDPRFNSDLKQAYDMAMAEGLWDKTYSKTNPDEYWAEGVQMYFDCARSASPPNGVHNEVCNRVQLKAYDPRLFALVDREFGRNPWRYEGAYNTTHVKTARHTR